MSVSPAGMAPLHLTDVLDGQSPVDAMRRLMGRCGCSHPLSSAGMSSSGLSLVARTAKFPCFRDQDPQEIDRSRDGGPPSLSVLHTQHKQCVSAAGRSLMFVPRETSSLRPMLESTPYS